MTGMEHAIEKAARIIHGCTGDEDGAPVAARALAEVGLLAPAPLTEGIEEAYQRGHEDGYWNGKTTDMTPAQAAAFMAPYRSRCPGLGAFR